MRRTTTPHSSLLTPNWSKREAFIRTANLNPEPDNLLFFHCILCFIVLKWH